MAIAFSQAKTGTCAAATSAQLTLTSRPVHHDTQLLYIAFEGAAAPSVSTVTQGGAAWSLVARRVGDLLSVECWASQNVGEGVSTEIAIAFSAAATAALVYESWTGCALSGAVNSSGSATRNYGVVNSHFYSSVSASLPTTQTLSWTPTNGNTLVAILAACGTGFGDTTDTKTTSLTQTGVTWPKKVNRSLHVTALQIWVAENVSGAGTQITFGGTTLGGNCYFAVFEISGVAAACYDTASYNAYLTSLTTPKTAGAITTAEAGELVIAAWVDGHEHLHTVSAYSTGFAALHSATQDDGAAEPDSNQSVFAIASRLVAAAGALTPSMTPVEANDSSTTAGAVAIKLISTVSVDVTAVGTGHVTGFAAWSDSTKTFTPAGLLSTRSTLTAGSTLECASYDATDSVAGAEAVGGALSTADNWASIAIALADEAGASGGIVPTVNLPPERREFFADTHGIWSIYRDSESVLDYTIDWSRVLGVDTIATSDWEVSGVTEDSSDSDTTTATIIVSGSGGEAKNTITTAAGNTHVRRLRFIAKDM